MELAIALRSCLLTLVSFDLRTLLSCYSPDICQLLAPNTKIISVNKIPTTIFLLENHGLHFVAWLALGLLQDIFSKIDNFERWYINDEESKFVFDLCRGVLQKSFLQFWSFSFFLHISLNYLTCNSPVSQISVFCWFWCSFPIFWTWDICPSFHQCNSCFLFVYIVSNPSSHMVILSTGRKYPGRFCHWATWIHCFITEDRRSQIPTEGFSTFTSSCLN